VVNGAVAHGVRPIFSMMDFSNLAYLERVIVRLSQKKRSTLTDRAKIEKSRPLLPFIV
jgi:hypothetical protein